MTTPLLSYAFSATGATTSRTLPDRLAEVVNVKDYGAKGDGFTDDAAALQAAFDAAWGPVSAPHASNNRLLNRPVVFPPGNYITTSTLYCQSVHGAWIMGAGSRMTTITYKGPISRTAKTNLIFTNGFAFARMEGISLVMTGGNTAADKTVCFNWNWNWTNYPAVNTTQFYMIDVSLSGASFGFLAADPTEPPGYGDECDSASFVNCRIESCNIGLYTANWNAILGAFLGGSVTDCITTGIWNAAAGIRSVCGTRFGGNGFDIVNYGGDAIMISGCYSASPNFVASGGHSSLVGCMHMATTAGRFLNTVADVEISIDGCRSLNGYLIGQGGYYIRDSQFDNPNWLNSTPYRGPIRELKTLAPLTFDTLPTGGWQAEGLLVSISDSPTAAWGANITAGGGANHVWIRWNGSNWTVVGA
jgi:hypothetical protein